MCIRVHAFEEQGHPQTASTYPYRQLAATVDVTIAD